jgi:hypothetical protein
MIYSAKPLLKNALDPDGAGHTLALPPDDPFIVSCPGSGKTWPRFLPENRLHPQEPATLASIERRVCDAELRLSPYRRCITSPRTIKNEHDEPPGGGLDLWRKIWFADLHLRPRSRCKKAGSDGKDLAEAVAAVDSATAVL